MEHNQENHNEENNDVIIDIVTDDSDKKKIPLKNKIKAFFSLFDDVASHEEIKNRIVSGGKITGTNASILIFAIIIACVGLNTNSIPVIIGAMLISPMMGTIMALAYGVESADKKMTISSFKGLFFQFIISFTIATLFFLISPRKEVTSELLSRTSPSFFDILIAFCGGAAGMIAQTREDKVSNVIPGVAIATALMPPICTMGFSLANGQWSMLLGASYLLLINIYYIFFSSSITLGVLKIPKVENIMPKRWKIVRFAMIRNSIIISIPAIVMAVLVIIGKI